MSVSNSTIGYNIAGSLLVKAASMAVSLASIPALLAYFYEDNNLLGTWLAFLTFTVIACSLDLGIGNRLKNDILIKISEGGNYSGLIRESIVAQIIISTTLTTIFIIALLSLTDKVGSNNYVLQALRNSPELIAIAAAIVLITMPLRLSYFILQAQQRNAWSAFIAMTPQLAVLAYVLLAGEHQPINRMIPLAVTLLIATTVVYTIPLTLMPQAREVFHKKYFKNEELIASLKAQPKKIVDGFAFFAIQISIIFLYSYNEIFYLAVGTTTDIVQYQYYFRPYSLFAVGFSIISLPFWSAISLSQLSNNTKRSRQLFVAILALNIPVTLALIPTAYFYQDLLDLWLGEGAYNSSISMVVMFSAFSILTCMMHALSSVLSAYDLISYQAKTLCAGLLMKVLSLLFLKSMGTSFDPVMTSTLIGLILVVTALIYKSIELWTTRLVVAEACQ